MTTPAEARDIVRSKGLCGYIYTEENKVCILDKGHNSNMHEKEWSTNGIRIASKTGVSFDADCIANALWLANLLNEFSIVHKEKQRPHPAEVNHAIFYAMGLLRKMQDIANERGDPTGAGAWAEVRNKLDQIMNDLADARSAQRW